MTDDYELNLLDELEEELKDFKRTAQYKKLTLPQWYELNTQLLKTPQINRVYDDIQFFPIGEHAVLRSILNRFGYYPMSRNEIMDMAYDLILLGYE